MATEISTHDAIDIGSYAIAQGILAMLDAGDSNDTIRASIYEIIDLTEHAVPHSLAKEIEEQRAIHLRQAAKAAATKALVREAILSGR